MLWPITTLALFLYFGWADIFRFYHGAFMDLFFSCFFLGFFSLIAVLVGFAIAAIVGLCFPKKWYGPEITALVSLRGGSGLHGSFFLGTGAIQTSQYYFFYRKAGEGYQPDKAAAEYVTVYEQDRTDGVLHTHQRSFAHSLSWLFGICLGSVHYEFYIPNGSIKREFAI